MGEHHKDKIGKKVDRVTAKVREVMKAIGPSVDEKSDLEKQVESGLIERQFADASLKIDRDPSNDVAYARAMQAATTACDEQAGWTLDWAHNALKHKFGHAPSPVEAGTHAAQAALKTVIQSYGDSIPPTSVDVYNSLMSNAKRLSTYCR